MRIIQTRNIQMKKDGIEFKTTSAEEAHRVKDVIQEILETETNLDTFTDVTIVENVLKKEMVQ